MNNLPPVFLDGKYTGTHYSGELSLWCAKPWSAQAIIEAYTQSEMFYSENTFDTSFVLIDYARKRTIAYRDFFGLTPLFYANTGNRYLFSFSINDVVTSGEMAALVNYRHLADFLNPAKKISIVDNQTFFEGVHRLLPNHVLLLEDGQEDRIFPAKPIDVEKYKGLDEEDYIRHFEQIFTESVKNAVRPFSRLGIHISGGIDSSSILAVTGSVSEKPIYTSYYDIDSVLASEQEFVDMMLRKYKTIHKNVKPAQNVYEISEEVIRQTGVPEAMLVPSSMLSTSIDFFAENHIDGLLSGRGGDQVVGTGKGYLDELYRQKKWKELQEAIYRFVDIRYDFYKNQDVLHFFWIASGVSESVKKFACDFMLKKAKQNFSLRNSIETIWVLNRYFSCWGGEVFETMFRYWKAKKEKKNAAGSGIFKPALWQKADEEPNDLIALDTDKLTNKPLSAAQKSMISVFYYALSVRGSEAGFNYLRAKSMKQEHPFYNTELLSLTLNTPLKLQFGKGILRGTIREAMKNYLPEQIKNRVIKGSYGEYGEVAFKSMYETFQQKEAGKDRNHAIWELVDKDNFDKLATRILNKTADFDAVVIALRVIYASIWLDYVESLKQ